MTYMDEINIAPLMDHDVNTFRHDKINVYFSDDIAEEFDFLKKILFPMPWHWRVAWDNDGIVHDA